MEGRKLKSIFSLKIKYFSLNLILFFGDFLKKSKILYQSQENGYKVGDQFTIGFIAKLDPDFGSIILCRSLFNF